MTLTRRSAVKGAAALGAGALAGCLSEPGGSDGSSADAGPSTREGYAAFYALSDWTGRVGGDRFAIETPVDVGKIGHGWSPDGDATRRIASSDVFVYLDTPEFAWAQDVVSQLEDSTGDVHVVDGMSGIDEDELLTLEDDEHADRETDHDHEHEHDDEGHEFVDPHVWTDPVLVGDIVDAIADGLAAVDPDGADAYEANAESYGEDLASVDEEYERVVSEADLDVAVFAGHDSFRYVERRYDFELHTPLGISPDERPSSAEIADTIDLVDDLGIRTILYDPFEAPADEIPPLAETIVAGSEATDYAPLTPGEGTTAEWAEEGWGWIEQMTEVNAASLEKALDGD